MKLAELMDQARQAAGNTQDMLALKQKLDDLGIHLENIYQELEMNSSYVDSHRDISFVGESVQPHSHSFFELICCCGCDQVQYLLGSQRYRLQRGDVILIPPGISHCPLFPQTMQRPYERIVMWINAEMLGQFYEKWPELDIVGQRSSHYLLRTAGTYWEDVVMGGFQKCCGESEKRFPGWEAALYGGTVSLLTQISRALNDDRCPPASEHTELLDELLAYVAEHLKERISIAGAARHILVSESTVTHLCRKRLGVSFYRYVTRQRLMEARKYMQQGLPLGQIWEQAGFCDYSAFYRAFKQEYGISPREYRNLQEGNARSPRLP